MTVNFPMQYLRNNKQLSGLCIALRFVVMVSTGYNNDIIWKNFVNQSVFMGDTARPMPRQIPFKRLRLAGSVERVSQYFSNQLIYLTKNLFVLSGPLPVFSKSGFLKTNHPIAARCSAHCMASSSVSKEIILFPCSTFLAAFSSLSRLAGELKRYSVSSCPRTLTSMFWSGYASLSELIKLFPSSLVLSMNTVSIV